MFLHIGKNNVINNKDIIGIFNINTINENVFNNLNNTHEILDISDNIAKTLILLKHNNVLKGYITNISSVTLLKRLNFKEA